MIKARFQPRYWETMTSEVRPTRSLSATGSYKVPQLVIWFVVRASAPSSASENAEKRKSIVPARK